MPSAGRILDAVKATKGALHIGEAVLEVVELRVSGSAIPSIEAARNLEASWRAQPGFRWPRLAALENGAFLDVSERADVEFAKAAAKQIASAEPASAVLALIDGPSVVARHTRLAIDGGTAMSVPFTPSENIGRRATAHRR